MSVFIRPDTKDGTYSYDFRLGGRRFSGGTGKTTKREAKQVEEARKAELKAALTVEREVFAKELSLQAATARYWQEVGQHHVNADNTLRALSWIVDHFGAGTMLHDIDDGRVAAMVAKRRGEFVPSQRKPGRKYKTPEVRRRVTPATVNRTATQPLREVILRAREIWGARTAKVKWADHLLAEPKERVREATPAEEGDMMEELERGYDEAVAFTFLNGCRRMEVIGLRWTSVDFFSRTFRVVGKGNKERTIPMTARSHQILWDQRGRHPDFVFTFEAKRTVRMRDGRLLCRGQRYPLTEAGFKSAARRAIARSGVPDFHFHDIRHTTATRVLRKSNLRVVQNLLGHEDVSTTTKYAHALIDDIRQALDAATETPATAEFTTEAAKSLDKSLKGK